MFDFEGVKGLIFDCDGTLLDTLDMWERAEHDLFAEAGALTQEQEDELHSAPIEEAARIFHERYGVGESADAVLDHIESMLLPFYANEAKVLPGVLEFVHAAREAGVPCIVLSSSPRRFIEAGLRNIGLDDAFIEIVTTDETGCSKQDAAIYDRACAILGADARDIWAIDDAPYAVRIMSDYGFNTIAPINGSGAERVSQIRESATMVVDTLESLL